MAKNEVVLTFAGDAKRLSGTFREIGEASDKLSSKVSTSSERIKRGFSVASTAIVAGAGVVVAGLAKMGSELDGAWDAIRTGTGATGEAFAQLQDDARAVARTVPAELGAIGQAIADVHKRTDQTGEGLQTLTTAFLQLGQVTGEDVPALIAAGTRVFGDWGVTADKQVVTLDKLFRASQATGIGVTKLADIVVQFGAPLRQLGFSFEESISLLGKWEKEGVNTELVLGGLKKALGTFAREGENPVKALGRFTEAIKNAGSTAAANKLAVETLGVKAGTDFAAAVREGRLEMDDLLKTVGAGPESIDKAARATEDFKERLLTLKNNAFLALEPVAMAVFGELDEGVKVLQDVGDWASKNEDTVKTLAIALGALAVTVVAVNVGTKVYTATLVLARGAQALWTAGVWLSNTAGVARLGTIIANNAALVAHVAVMGVVRGATLAWTAVQWLLNAALTANPIGLIIVGIGLLVAAIVWIATKTTWFQTAWKKSWGVIKFIAMGVWDWLKGLPERLGRVFRAVSEFITRPFRAAFNAVADLWNNTIGKLSWTVPGWVPFIGGNTISVPKLPKFHTGGTVPGVPGQEVLAVLKAGERVSTAAEPGVAGGRMVLELRSSGNRVDDLLVEILARAVKARGGNVQVAVTGRA